MPLPGLAGHGQTVVFAAGEDGRKVYRIPAIVRLPNGDLAAFCEGRVRGSGDFGDVEIVMKLSGDGGETWSPARRVADNDSLQAGNPAPVVDRSDPKYPRGRLFLFYNTGNAPEGKVREGRGLREVWYITSADGGRSFSPPVNITRMVHRPRQPAQNPGYAFAEDWRCYANTPGHAIQITEGKFRGRIFVAANHSAGEPQNNFEDYNSHGFYTDDHGMTFQLGGNLEIPGSNEATAAELSGDRLIMNARNQRGDRRARIVAESGDGGKIWSNPHFDYGLPDPVCQGSILAVGKENGMTILAFCNPADSLIRDNLTLRISYDEGRSWEKKNVVDRSQDRQKTDWAAYCDIVGMDESNVGVLYESDNYSKIVFKKMPWR